MKFKHLLLTAVASVLLGTEAFAASAYGYDAVSNEALYTSMMRNLRTLQTDLIGEPIYFMAQNLMLEIQAVHKEKPYAWVGQVHRFISLAENMYPASLGHPSVGTEDKYDRIRRQLLMLRDYPMHQVSDVKEEAISPEGGQAAAFHEANKQWLQHKRSEFFQFLAAPAPTDGSMQMFKLYSSGVVCRTKGACIGIDICYQDGTYDGERRDELAQALDVVYVTHAHGDHYDIPLLRRMLDLGKIVVAPSTMEKHLTSYSSLKGSKLFLWDENSAPADPMTTTGSVKTQAYMSGQGDEPCLLYLIELDGWRVVHIGDNSKHENEAFYENHNRADIVISPVFQGNVAFFTHTMAAPNPLNIDQIYVNIHENEWHHTVDHRVPFSFMYNNTGALGNSSFSYPLYIATDCGESFTLYK